MYSPLHTHACTPPPQTSKLIFFFLNSEGIGHLAWSPFYSFAMNEDWGGLVLHIHILHVLGIIKWQKKPRHRQTWGLGSRDWWRGTLVRDGKSRPGEQRYILVFWDVGRKTLNNLMFSSVKSLKGDTVARAFFQAEVPVNSKWALDTNSYANVLLLFPRQFLLCNSLGCPGTL